MAARPRAVSATQARGKNPAGKNPNISLARRMANAVSESRPRERKAQNARERRANAEWLRRQSGHRDRYCQAHRQTRKRHRAVCPPAIDLQKALPPASVPMDHGFAATRRKSIFRRTEVRSM